MNSVQSTPPKTTRPLFPEDTSPISSSEPEETTTPQPVKKPKQFDFGKTSTHSDSPTLSPILISSDEELERSMAELEERISLEMDLSD